MDLVRQVISFLDGNHWTYQKENGWPEGIHVFELSFRVEGMAVKMKVKIDEERKACVITGFFPILVDPVYSYPLCQLIAKENRSKLFGALMYDERNGELTYEYTYPASRGIDNEEFEKMFYIVLKMVSDEYKVLRGCCQGRFTKQEVSEIAKKIQGLVNDIVR